MDINQRYSIYTCVRCTCFSFYKNTDSFLVLKTMDLLF